MRISDWSSDVCSSDLIVSRVYAGSGRDAVMMVIAYGDSQSDTLQLHRPEVCYEAAGFKITRSEPVAFDVGLRAPLTGRYVVAEAAYRKEAIPYWTRIADALPVSRLDQQMSKLEAALDGVVRSEERRVGKECVSTCRSGWSPYH